MGSVAIEFGTLQSRRRKRRRRRRRKKTKKKKKKGEWRMERVLKIRGKEEVEYISTQVRENRERMVSHAWTMGRMYPLNNSLLQITRALLSYFDLN